MNDLTFCPQVSIIDNSMMKVLAFWFQYWFLYRAIILIHKYEKHSNRAYKQQTSLQLKKCTCWSNDGSPIKAIVWHMSDHLTDDNFSNAEYLFFVCTTSSGMSFRWSHIYYCAVVRKGWKMVLFANVYSRKYCFPNILSLWKT